jgi:hypothetical protein
MNLLLTLRLPLPQGRVRDKAQSEQDSDSLLPEQVGGILGVMYRDLDNLLQVPQQQTAEINQDYLKQGREASEVVTQTPVVVVKLEQAEA